MSNSRFETFLSTFDPQAHRRGQQWEEVCQWFLQTDPVYLAQLTHVWLWNEWPGRWGPDAGIDLVAEAKNGELWAIQAKNYAPDTRVTKHDVDTFLSESARPTFSYRLLIATTSRVAPAAHRAMTGQEKPADTLLRHDLERREGLTWPTSFAKWKRGQLPAPRPKRPRPHQKKALQSAIDQLAEHDRGQLVLACGTGKTLVALWLHERLASKRTLVLVPSLSLLKQTLQEWVANWSQPFEVLPVCSDDTVRPDERDAVVSSVTELGFPATTARAEVREFLKRRGPRVVFSTYQSSPVIAEALRGTRLRFDLAIADEAHRCAGPVSSEFATVLDQSRIPSRKRVFMTATPRYFTGRVVKAAREEDLEVASMDDEAVFGPVMHRLSFAQAIDKDLLSDYRVLVIGVDDEQYQRYAERGQLLTLEGTQATDARSLASHIGLAKAMRRYDMSRVLTFHGRVVGATQFARALPAVVEWMPPAERPSGVVWAKVVSGAMSSGARAVRLDRLRHVEDDKRGVLSNARCLGEGVDIPTLDGVAFIDPKHSQVDIVQAVGRAIRKGEGKSIATIVIPVFVDLIADPEHALDTSAFAAIAAVLRALRDHDEALAEELDGLRRQLGALSHRRLRLPTKIVLDLPKSVSSDFSTAVATRVVRLATASWEEWFAHIEEYVKTEGDARVPSSYTTLSGDKLGRWVVAQRVARTGRRGQLSAERQQRLEALSGWVWDLDDAIWEEWFSRLQQYVKRNGHTRMPAVHTSPDGENLGRWVINQRVKQKRLSPERRKRLEVLPGWVWHTGEAAWEASFARAQEYARAEGHTKVPSDYTTPDGERLGSWVGNQRQIRKRLSAERRERLEGLPGWMWNKYEATWEEQFANLERFVATRGHARVPGPYKTPYGDKLGSWVGVQRMARKKLSTERRERLESLPGWTWNPHEAAWEDGFAQLQDFVATKGHTPPARQVTPGGYELGNWVSTQRLARKKLSADRRKRLEAVPGWEWDPFQTQWNQGFAYLQDFATEHGHSRVPAQYTAQDGYKLGVWVTSQRANKEKLSGERRKRLEALPGWVWDPRDAEWEEGFTQLQQFVATNGNARVPRSLETRQGLNLGQWVTQQRGNHKKKRLSPERRARLEALPGWVWDAREAKWEEKFAELEDFVRKSSHALVPDGYATPTGFTLGKWVGKQRSAKNRSQGHS